jgi:hypothetical protein
MALTVAAPSRQGVMGNFRYSVVDITWDASYATGGLALTPAQVGLSAILYATDVGNYDADGKLVVGYDATNSKLAAYGGDGGAVGASRLLEIANAQSLATVTSRVLFLGY